jgi:hypothetical protein
MLMESEMSRVAPKVEKVARALAARRYGHCGGADACTMVSRTPNWRFCIPDAMTAVMALRKDGQDDT